MSDDGPVEPIVRVQYVVGLLFLCLFSLPSWAVDWPQEMQIEQGKIIIYQPQPEKLQGNVLTGRSAMSLELKKLDEPIFGVFWFRAQIDTDREQDLVNVHNIEITKVRWPDSTDEQEKRFTDVVEQNLPKTGFNVSMASLSASLEAAEVEVESLANLKNDPPNIVFKESLSVLLIFDGKPTFKEISDNYKRALNTPFLVLGEVQHPRYYLSNGTEWYAAKDPMGPWEATMNVPMDMVEVLRKATGDQSISNQSAMKEAPAIVTATEPTELIATDGKAQWEPLLKGDILYVKNTETPWLRSVEDGHMYVLLSGRWFRAKTQSGPWSFVRPDELPPSFADIPPASDIGGIRTSIAGTPEAEEAVMDAHIPQTAAIKRSEATLKVDYDGVAKFEHIPGTKVSYAVNTGSQVLMINKKYFAVDNGVWFVSDSATGPWVVADDIPKDEIAEIPPSSPVYNTKYVHVYHSTPTVVYVGYTPGYMWSFPYYGVPVYGTGWYYPPYMGGIYYPRPPTWGLHVGYNPWMGWHYGVSWSYGFLSVGFSWSGGYHRYPYGHGWYGGGYRPPVYINTGNINRGNINIGNTINTGNRQNIANKLAKQPNLPTNQINKGNIYNRPENRARNLNQGNLSNRLNNTPAASNRANNIYADRDGNVMRHQNNQWQTRQQNSWQTDRSVGPRISNETVYPRQQPNTRDRQSLQNRTNTRQNTMQQPPGYSRQQQLNRSHQSRMQGNMMHQQRNMMRSAGPRRR